MFRCNDERYLIIFGSDRSSKIFLLLIFGQSLMKRDELLANGYMKEYMRLYHVNIPLPIIGLCVGFYSMQQGDSKEKANIDMTKLVWILEFILLHPLKQN